LHLHWIKEIKLSFKKVVNSLECKNVVILPFQRKKNFFSEMKCKNVQCDIINEHLSTQIQESKQKIISKWYIKFSVKLREGFN